jgi:hypothetical protein
MDQSGNQTRSINLGKLETTQQLQMQEIDIERSPYHYKQYVHIGSMLRLHLQYNICSTRPPQTQVFTAHVVSSDITVYHP